MDSESIITELWGLYWLEAVFSSFKIPKILQDSPSHRIFGHMHGALNIGKK
jgi:hypothetical protein